MAPQPLGSGRKQGEGVGDSKSLDPVEEDNFPQEDKVEGGDSKTGNSAFLALDPSSVSSGVTVM